jgi:hypothetical protein
MSSGLIFFFKISIFKLFLLENTLIPSNKNIHKPLINPKTSWKYTQNKDNQYITKTPKQTLIYFSGIL